MNLKGKTGAENIKYHPKSYVMSEELKDFFTEITKSESLQQQLFNTKKLSEVANIAQELGFNIHSHEIVKAQAGRVVAILEEKSEDVKKLISGMKPKTGAQWGRGGGGFLDSAGYWLLQPENSKSTLSSNMLINEFIDKIQQDPTLKQQIVTAKTFDELANSAKTTGFNLIAEDLLKYQAQKNLDLDNTYA